MQACNQSPWSSKRSYSCLWLYNCLCFLLLRYNVLTQIQIQSTKETHITSQTANIHLYHLVDMRFDSLAILLLRIPSLVQAGSVSSAIQLFNDHLGHLDGRSDGTVSKALVTRDEDVDPKARCTD